ncbi:elongation factor 1-beta [Candidatus Woesearchaeota archaeon]|nr:elongation factor 1-beta [Candidatus Woesearchaeota archaeon]
MANVIVTLKVMPASPMVDMEALEAKVKETLKESTGETETRTEVEPIAFGLKALKVIFVADEAKGSVDDIAEKVESFDEVNSAEITDVRRAVG